MNKLTVEFLAFEGCPLAPKALHQLEQAVERIKKQLTVSIRQVDLMHPDTTESVQRWGSPTILLNGRDISGAEPGDANCCRIYPGPDGVLSEQEILDALKKATVK